MKIHLQYMLSSDEAYPNQNNWDEEDYEETFIKRVRHATQSEGDCWRSKSAEEMEKEITKEQEKIMHREDKEMYCLKGSVEESWHESFSKSFRLHLVIWKLWDKRKNTNMLEAALRIRNWTIIKDYVKSAIQKL